MLSGTTLFDHALYGDVFCPPAMRAVFTDRAQVEAYVAAEVALAVAQGRTGSSRARLHRSSARRRHG